MCTVRFRDNTLCVITLSGQLYTNIGLTQTCPSEQGSCTIKDGVKISYTSTKAHALCVVIVWSSYNQFLTSLQMVTTCQYYRDKDHIESPGRSKMADRNGRSWNWNLPNSNHRPFSMYYVLHQKCLPSLLNSSGTKAVTSFSLMVAVHALHWTAKKNVLLTQYQRTWYCSLLRDGQGNFKFTIFMY